MDFTGITYNFDLPIMEVLQGSDSVFFDRVIYALTTAWTWIPLYLMLLVMVIKNNETTRQILMLMLFAILSVACADIIIDTIAKPMCMRWRPTRDPMLKYMIDVVNNYRGGPYGFFSAHAANTMAIAVFFSLIAKSRVFATAMIGWSLLNGYTRIYLGVHYPSDVLTGWVCGCLIGYAFYQGYKYVNRKTTTQKSYISTQYTSTGYAFVDINMVLGVLYSTIIITILMGMFPL